MRGNINRSFLVARSNVRKSKGETVSIVVLVLLAAFLLNLWLMLSTDYKANFDRYHQAYNAQHVTLAADGNSGAFQSFLSKTLEADSRTDDYCLDHCMHMTSTFSYNGGEINAWVVFSDQQTALTRRIGRVEIVEEGSQTSGIYLPLLYKSDEIAVGKTMELTIGSHKKSYTVCGFFNSVMTGSHNCTMLEMILTGDQYAELEKSGYAPQATLCFVRLKDRSESLSYEASLKNAVSGQTPNSMMMSNCYATVSQSRYISQMICSGIMSAMAFFVLLIALVVMISNIIHDIQANMKNLGVLKAAGYTSGQLICSLLLQFLSLTLFAAAAGIGLSYLFYPAVNTMMVSQTGIPYEIRFLPVPLFLSLAILSGAVALAVWLASRRIKKIEPITALRCGIATHSFKRNHVPLDKANLPLNLALALKTTLSGIRHNLTVCITMLVLSLVVVFSGLMSENVIMDRTPFLTIVVGEIADSCISVRASAEHEFLHKAKADPRVENIYLYTSLDVSHAGGTELMAMVCDDFAKSNNQGVIVEGRFPKYDNEAAIAVKYAKENGFLVGDEISIEENGRQETYLICGLTQISNNLGRDCLLTREGYERLGEIVNTNYYINLAGGTDIDAFNQEMEESMGSSAVNTTINIQQMVDSMSGVYVRLITIIVIAVLALSALITAFVLYLLVRTLLRNKMRDYGILKALGFTTRQLVLQTALSFLPVMVVSTAVGIFVSSLVINPLVALFLGGIGIVKCSFAVPAGFVVAAGMGMVLFAFVTVCLLALRVKKIAPRVLLVGE